MVSTALAIQVRDMFGAWSRLSLALPLQSDHEFVLKAPLGNPFYLWPRTLLSYPIDSDAQIATGTHRLLCVETKEPVAFQISKTTGNSELLFFSDLPLGGMRTYRLEPSTSSPSGIARTQVKVSSAGQIVTIDAGPIQIRIPGSQTVTGDAPGPILGLCRGGEWSGISKLKVPSHAVISIRTEQLEDGPLRSTHRMTYAFAGGGKYVATVQCCVGVDFVRLSEDMEAIPEGALGEFDFTWNGCRFDYRQSPNHPWPDNFSRKPMPKYSDYPWEAIAPARMDTQSGVAAGVSSTGKMPFSLRLFDPWGDVAAASFANFWGNTSSDAAAIFIDHAEQWRDHEYAIWHSSAKIAVEFVYSQDTLHFVWKIARGTRSSCVSFYDHAKDIETMSRLEQDYQPGRRGKGAPLRTGLFPTSYALQVQNWHGTLNLDKCKDWLLSYAPTAELPKPLFTFSRWKNAREYYETLTRSDFVSQLAISGVRQNHGFGPTSSRQIMGDWVPGYQIFQSQFTPAEREHVQTILLLMAYVHADEDYMPMQRMLAGHPNFLSDVKSTPPGMAFLFPEHPSADVWADEWEAYLRLNTRYHTRPAVEAWNARGGRWTENLGTYVWAALRPASRASFLLKCRDGHERFASPQLISLGDWLVNALSAPFDGESPATMKIIAEESATNNGAKRHYWGIVSPSDGPRRLHPPIGAHSERRKTPRTMWYIGSSLMNYSPLTAEHLMWAARPTDQDMEATVDPVESYDVMFAQPDNRGTNPHLRTAKYTGYGITLRAAVDTPQELSIHLMQIDEGPNYRWGNPNGIIYFYANGKGYSHNGTEDAGDRVDQDTDFNTNFGVWKDGAFRSIGKNVLSRPLYDLEIAQFAEIVPSEGANASSWPEYVSRSIMLAGDDYFIVHDRVYNPEINHRFSWFVRKGDDFPEISLLTSSRAREDDRFTSVETETTSGKWADGSGDSIVLVTHKKGIHAEAASFGGRIMLADGSDLVLAAPTPIEFNDGKNSFSGTSGIIRNRNGGWEIALFHGTHISAVGFSITTHDTNLGISARISNEGAVSGHFFAPSSSEIVLDLPAHWEKLNLYIDGSPATASRDAGRLNTQLPAGAHRWELTTTLPMPLAPSIYKTVYRNAGADIHGIPVASASSYTLEVSSDDAKTWKEMGVARKPAFPLAGLTNGSKYHVRITAKNTDRTSDPGPEYPLYITHNPPPAPDGLRITLSAGIADISWGEVLGVAEYRLYRKKKGDSQFRIAYNGYATSWKDVDPAILPPAVSPLGLASTTKAATPLCEYYVTASNHNGESRSSRSVNTDPASWRNWNPTGGEPFRRTVERSEGTLPNDGVGRYYPEMS